MLVRLFNTNRCSIDTSEAGRYPGFTSISGRAIVNPPCRRARALWKRCVRKKERDITYISNDMRGPCGSAVCVKEERVKLLIHLNHIKNYIVNHYNINIKPFYLCRGKRCCFCHHYAPFRRCHQHLPIIAGDRRNRNIFQNGD